MRPLCRVKRSILDFLERAADLLVYMKRTRMCGVGGGALIKNVNWNLECLDFFPCDVILVLLHTNEHTDIK